MTDPTTPAPEGEPRCEKCGKPAIEHSPLGCPAQSLSNAAMTAVKNGAQGELKCETCGMGFDYSFCSDSFHLPPAQSLSKRTTETPETDAECYLAVAFPAHQTKPEKNKQSVVVAAKVARSLECRLAALKRENEGLREELAPLRELVGVDARCASAMTDIHHWSKMMDKADEADRLRADLATKDAQIAELRGALEAGQQNCDVVYNDLRVEREEALAEARAATARAEAAEAELGQLRGAGSVQESHDVSASSQPEEPSAPSGAQPEER